MSIINLRNRIHNLALDLKTGLITWKKFDEEIEKLLGDVKDGLYILD